MSIVPIVKVPNELLRAKCEKVKKGDPELKTLVQNLIDTLNNAKNPQGAGLAAPQIGVLKRVILVRNFFDDPTDPNKTLFENIVFINPKVISHSTNTDTEWEGCLSVPDTFGKVRRYKSIKVKTEDVDGNEYVIKANGFFSRTIQHEMDHLEGIIFTTIVEGKTVAEKTLDQMYREGKE